MKYKITAGLLMALCLGMNLAGCGSSAGSEEVNTFNGTETMQETEEEEQVTLRLTGPWPDCPGLETAAAEFNRENPQCHIVYEYLQDYDATLPLRLAGDEDKVDLFLCNYIHQDSELGPYTLELSGLGDQLDLSDAFQGLLDNAKDQSGNEAIRDQFYSVALGAEVRGMFVNETLLGEAGIEIPKNRQELLTACEVLKEKGYVPVQGNPGQMGQHMMYPYICNMIANAKDPSSVYEMVNRKDAQMVDYFADPLEFLYGLMENEYYNYKYSETELNLFTDISNEGYARSFLNIAETEDGYVKTDDVGQVAFMPAFRSMEPVIATTKEDYHSEIKYQFIMSPVGEEGGYAYLSPGRAISVAKDSDEQEWCIRFLNYIFEEKNNVKLAEAMGFVPNTSGAMSILEKEYDLPENRICQLGQVTFDYDFFTTVNNSLIEISKGNNPKYMEVLEDGSTQLYPFSYYMDNFRTNLTAETQ